MATLNDELYDVTVNNTVTKDILVRYLTIYVGTCNWDREIDRLYKRLKCNPDKLKQVAVATVLLPYIDRSTYIDSEHPENLLHKMPYYQQLQDRDWWEEFKKVFAKDTDIEAYRHKAYAMGVVSPLEYSPMTRQAFNWLYSHAEERGVITSPEIKKDVSERFRNLVSAYGGAVICNIFSRHAEKLKRVINWRTGYFFERVIFEVYDEEQVYKIKRAELDNTNEKLVKSVRIV